MLFRDAGSSYTAVFTVKSSLSYARMGSALWFMYIIYW